MFHDLDKTLQNILIDQTAPAALRAAGVSFRTPERNFVPENPDSAINLFLYEVKEIRELRGEKPWTAGPPIYYDPDLMDEY